MSDTESSPEQSLSSFLSIEEQCALATGASHWATQSFAVAEIPSIKMTDGPSGARGDMSRLVPSAAFPVGVALGASWDVDLVEDVATHLARETKYKRAQVLLGPTINLQRTPVGGRGFEAFSEDPVLTAELAVSYVKTLSKNGIGTCPKHFIANDCEWKRFTINVEMADAALREIYLLPFEQVVKRAEPAMIMAAYNRFRGYSCSQNDFILNQILKTEWGYRGVVVSDWFAARDTVECAIGGLDLEMPGPGRVWGRKLLQAIDAGRVSHATIADKADRIARLAMRTIRYDTDSETGPDDADTRQLIRRAGAECMVVLKNEGVLPLSPHKLSRLAVIGPNAKTGQVMGGGSSFVLSHPIVHPLAAITERFAGDRVAYAEGVSNCKFLPHMQGKWRVERYSDNGLCNLEHAQILPSSHFEALDSGESVYRLTGAMKVDSSGSYKLGIATSSPAVLCVDAVTLIDQKTSWERGSSFMGLGSTETIVEIDLEAGREYDVQLTMPRPASANISGARIGMARSGLRDDFETALDLARNSDACVLVLGSNADWESEGHDRTDMKLPGRQNELAAAVLAVQPNTVVVLNVGGPVEMPWVDAAKSILVSWFPGEEFGNSLVDVLTGATEASGRLPFSWPRSMSDHPAMTGYPPAGRELRYVEGVNIGYRGLSDPLFPFGFGVGAGQTEITAAALCDGHVEVSLSHQAGETTKATVQVYAEWDDIVALVAFCKILVPQGADVTTRFPINQDYLRRWSDHGWTCPSPSLKIGFSAQGPFVPVVAQ